MNMEEHLLYWVWLTIKPAMNSTKITWLWEHFETIKDIYEETEYNDIAGIGPSEISALRDKSLDAAKKVVEQTERAGAKILTYEDINFPDMLRNIIDPPYVLYIKGEIMNWDRLLPIGVVGTRKSTDYGKLVTNRISRDMTKMGITVVSGMARGLDASAAWAALRAGGKTIAVLGSGIDVIYPPDNKNLYEEICEHGAVITEYPPGSEPLPGHFPERNRIIARLSKGLLVTEAPKDSGALITARCALENGRDIFAVPGNIFDEHYVGTNNLIQQGAKLVMSAQDVMDEYPYAAKLLRPPKIQVVIKTQNMPHYDGEESEEYNAPIQNEQKITIESKKYLLLDDEEKKIIQLLIEANMHIDDIARRLEKPVG
ncbi:MAG: DNA-processing protein DprA [Oscillospiraceae bacterium]|nr:DNA-processing protein DprA [Oscillospiraceae bacterium]